MRLPWVALLCLVACRDGSPPNEQPARRPAEDTPRERVFTPRVPLHRVVLVLEQIRARFRCKAVGHEGDRPFAPDQALGAGAGGCRRARWWAAVNSTPYIRITDET